MSTLSTSTGALSTGTTRLHSALITVSAICVVIFVINYFYPSQPYIIAVQAATLAYILILFSSRIAMSAAKVETPHVPAAGESLNKNEKNIADVNQNATSREVIESVINQEEQNFSAHQHLLGILYGTLGVIVGSALLSGYYVEDKNWLVFAFYMSTSMCLMYRARNYVDRDAHIVLLWSALITAFAYTIGLAVSDPYGNLPQIGAMIAATFVSVLVGSLWALGQRTIKAPTTRRWFELLEFAMYAAPVVWLGLLMDAYMKARNR